MFGSLKKKQYLCIRIRKKMIFRGVAQLVAFLVWDQAVAGSSPVTSTKRRASVLLFFVSIL